MTSDHHSAKKQKAVVARGSGGAGGLGRRSPQRPKAVVAMSGGVDSSVAAALMVEQGYAVTGIMLKLWRQGETNTESGCCSVGAADDARRVADLLEIPFYVLNFAERFESSVVSDFRSAYASGRTPNPCVRCNQWIKFDALLERAEVMGADVLVTGHYARVRTDDGRARLLRGVDGRKDQSYVLWMLTQERLARCRFPVGGMNKKETRALAARLGLRTATKPDSQEICFVRGGDLGGYISEHVSEASHRGAVVDERGRVVGEHHGFGRYTVGQRKGLGVALGRPVYVTSIDASSNRIVVGERKDLEIASARLEEVSFVGPAPRPGERVLVQHRAHGDVTPARVTGANGAAQLLFERPIEAVAPGQSAVLYSVADPDELVGGGIVASTEAA
ncbi:MAG TPA: tRNA 2-thiouridine(34) synthase MnmA [Actinomycetota bacterium]|nr:tRNA 2-thiouridine(34) synthase MnmA [Actinomycetota bacterium]